MKRDETSPILSAIFVDYDNIYMSLKRKNDEAAKRFAKLAQDWLKGIETGSLITATNGVLGTAKRRIVMNRCYGNPVPRRNSQDNSTDMNSFTFVRHHFLRAGCEVVDCPPLTAQLKNSSDIRMVMDVRDYLSHETYFDEFVILSGDADFTPLLQRLRQHARRTVIYCNEYTAQPYTAICDGEVREADLIALLMAQDGQGALPSAGAATLPPVATTRAQPSLPDTRAEIIAEVVASVRAAQTPVPLEALADRALRVLGHEKTVNTSWAGAGSFRELLRQSLPGEIQLTEQPPYFAFDPKRHSPQDRLPLERPPLGDPSLTPVHGQAARALASAPAPREQGVPPLQSQPVFAPERPASAQHAAALQPAATQALPRPVFRDVPPPPVQPQSATQQSIARIYEACQAPALAPAEYRAVFEILADEINENSLSGAQTLNNVVARAQARGLELRRDDARFILEVVSEPDPWFEHGASATLFGGRFRNFVVGRCRSQGLNLSAEELDLIDGWFAGTAAAPPARPPLAQQGAATALSRWQASPGGVEPVAAGTEDFPRIVRARR